MSWITVEITTTQGSVPRDAGTVMRVSKQEIEGTIGGGALEHRAIDTARRMLTNATTDLRETLPLGPGLGQCCGGAVTLHYSDQPKIADLIRTRPMDRSLLPSYPLGPLWLWGAGHVGRAIVRSIGPSNAFNINWTDTSPERFPPTIPANIKATPTADMPRLAAFAPRDAHHLIFTYSHDIDLALCAALLKRGFASCGLIGSATKWTRFQRRLRAVGLNPTAITCPIGDPLLGKHPDQIAHSTVTALLRFAQNSRDSAATESAVC